MNTEVGKAVAEVLDVLAAKFGTTAAYLWAVMVRQEYVYGWFALGLSALFVGAGVFYVRWCLAWAAKGEEENRTNSYSRADVGGRRMMAFIGVAVFAIAAGLGYDAMTGILNPEYGALRKVLSLITSK